MKAQARVVGFQWMGSRNPFLPGESKTAIAEFHNPTEYLFPYRAELHFNKPPVVSSGAIFFNLEAGESKPIHFPVDMPNEEGIYSVFLDLFSDEQYIAAYQAREDVVIVAPAPVLPELPPEIYQGMLPPEGWEWTRCIGEQELRAAQTRAASTGETVMEALLALYGKEVPVTPVQTCGILDIKQGPDKWVGPRGYDYYGLSFIATWELFQEENVFWGAKLFLPNFAGFSTIGSLQEGAPGPPRRTDSPGVPLKSGVYNSLLPSFQLGGAFSTYFNASFPIVPGEYEIGVTIFKEGGGFTSPAWSQDVCSLKKRVMVRMPAYP